jgi:thioredoxin-like negative regulator of GroEL
MVGLIVLVVVLAVATAAGFAMRSRQGSFRAAQAPKSSNAATDAPRSDVLSAADLGTPLGERATLVQFSTEVCAYCPSARRLLTTAAAGQDGVSFVEIDAAHRMDLTKRLHVMATPTVLVLDAAGGIASRSSGPQRRADIEDALGKVLASEGARP